MNATTYLRKKEASFWVILRMDIQVNGHAARVEHPAES